MVFGVALLVQVWALYVPSAPSVDTGLPLDKVVHAALFALVTWLGLRLGYRWIIPAMIAQAALSELVQWWFLPQRSGDIADLLADLLGVALAWAISSRPASFAPRRRSAAGSAGHSPDRTPRTP